MTLAPGARLGPYEIQGVIGAGGMGVVYRARDPRLDRTVAIKVLSSSTAADPVFHERFTREARSISALEHPHIGAVYDVGDHNGTPYLVMQYLDGETLTNRLARGPLPFDQALALGIQVADALVAAHAHGIVHRDLKPANIILTKSGAKLLDFGLAKRREGVVGSPGSGAVTAANALGAATPITERGTILGTFHYMSPEQLRGEDADARSDIFAFGAVMYEAVSGRRPFEAADTASLIAAVLDRDPPLLAAREVVTPPRFERTLRTCLEKDPSERWQSSRDLLRELRWIAEEQSQTGSAVVPPPSRPSRRRWIAAAVAVIATVAIAAWGVLGRSQAPAIGGPPVIVLMDSQHPARVYDPATRQSGGTNADDLTDLLRDLPVVLMKENTGPSWHREDQILRQNPSIILVHRSCFYDSTLLGDPALDEKYRDQLYPWPADKLEAFMGYVAQANPQTRFVVYSRRGWPSDAERLAWMTGVERRFPTLKGRLHSYNVPLDRATFRHSQTGEEIRKIVVGLLGS